MIELTDDKNLTCKVMMLPSLGMGGEAALWGTSALHAWCDALSFSVFNLNMKAAVLEMEKGCYQQHSPCVLLSEAPWARAHHEIASCQG